MTIIACGQDKPQRAQTFLSVLFLIVLDLLFGFTLNYLLFFSLPLLFFVFVSSRNLFLCLLSFCFSCLTRLQSLLYYLGQHLEFFIELQNSKEQSCFGNLFFIALRIRCCMIPAFVRIEHCAVLTCRFMAAHNYSLRPARESTRNLTALQEPSILSATAESQFTAMIMHFCCAPKGKRTGLLFCTCSTCRNRVMSVLLQSYS